MTNVVDLEDWACLPDRPPLPVAEFYRIRLWDGNGFDEKRNISDPKPTPEQILEAYGLRPVDNYVLLDLEQHGVSELPFGEPVDISDRRAERFFAFKTDRTYKVKLNGDRFPWGSPRISGEMLRLIGRIPDNHQIILQRTDKPDLVLEDNDTVALDDAGLETLFSRKAAWKLLVQGVMLTLSSPTIVVRDALIEAGLDPDKGWIAALKIKGQPREAIGLDGIIDLTKKGIEKLWLRPSNIQNGEAPIGLRRDFDLDDRDRQYLDKRGIAWDTVMQGAGRWVILRLFPLPTGYTVSVADIAIQIPATYPIAALDMFYCAPFLQLTSGRLIPQTQGRQTLDGQTYQRWSRHRQGETVWNPNADSLITHIAIIDESLSREVE